MLRWKISPRGPAEVEVRLKGDITERVDFDDLKVDAHSVVLVVDGVRFINSVGVKRLGAFLAELSRRGPVAMERCAPAVVAQLNLVPSLAKHAQIRSVIAPLECNDCVAERDVLIALGGGAGVPEVPPQSCIVCGGEMLLAELEKRYFAFLEG